MISFSNVLQTSLLSTHYALLKQAGQVIISIYSMGGVSPSNTIQKTQDKQYSLKCIEVNKFK